MDDELDEEELGQRAWRPDPEVIARAIKTFHPSPQKKSAVVMDRKEKIAFIANKFQEILEALGMDLSDPSLARTPQRIAKMYVEEIFAGLDEENFPRITLLPNLWEKEAVVHPIFIKSTFTSFCEHHFVPMYGTAYVAYCPRGKLIGLSKVPRLVHYFAKRPQLQERLTAQIADALALLLDIEDVAVSITAQHFCVIARGIENNSSHTTTTVLRGRFEKELSLRSEFFEAIARPFV